MTWKTWLNLFPGRVFVVLLTLSQLDSNSESHAYAPAGVYDLRAFGFFFCPCLFFRYSSRNVQVTNDFDKVPRVKKKKTWPAGGGNPRALNSREDLLRRSRKPPNPLAHPYIGAPLLEWVRRAGTFLYALAWWQMRGFSKPQAEIRSHKESNLGPRECY